jgi:hypothetical protein
MALQSSGSISFSQIAAEFGTPSGKNMGAFRVSQTVSALSNLPLDTGVPQTGQIKFSDFYNKRLNVVVDCGSGNKVNAKTNYTNNTSVTVIGGFLSKPTSPTGARIWIHTNGTIASDQSAASVTQTYCSLLTGSWDSSNILQVDVGPSGVVLGAGGDGGGGGSANTGSVSGGNNGVNGTSAVGVSATNTVIITNRGTIAGGGGGGGGGGGAEGYTHQSGYNADGYADAAGSGGGGGAGSPAGSGGSTGSASCIYRCGSTGANNGGNGTTSSAGGGGAAAGVGGGNGTTATGGAGGNGGGLGSSASSGGSGSAGGARVTTGTGGSSGAGGYSIVVTSNGTGVSISGNTLQGSVAYSTSPS